MLSAKQNYYRIAIKVLTSRDSSPCLDIERHSKRSSLSRTEKFSLYFLLLNANIHYELVDCVNSPLLISYYPASGCSISNRSVLFASYYLSNSRLLCIECTHSQIGRGHSNLYDDQR